MRSLSKITKLLLQKKSPREGEQSALLKIIPLRRPLISVLGHFQKVSKKQSQEQIIDHGAKEGARSEGDHRMAKPQVPYTKPNMAGTVAVLLGDQSPPPGGR